jgi:hypothetical protein
MVAQTGRQQFVMFLPMNAISAPPLLALIPISGHQFLCPGWPPHCSLGSESCDIRFDIQHWSAVNRIETFYFDSQVVDREQAANRDPNPIRPVLPPLSENATSGQSARPRGRRAPK